MSKSTLFIVSQDATPEGFRSPQIPNNLVAQPTPLIGREQEVVAALNLVQQPQVRLLTLIGPGGVGKTRLAYQLAAESMAEFQDGVYLIELAPLSDPELVVPTIARTLGVREVPDAPVSSTLREQLADKKMLLVLDNFEQVLAAGKAVSDLLSACPDLKVLVTSRSPLRLRAETQLVVEPLSLPEAGRALSLTALSQYGAVAFFVERARAVLPEFELTQGNAYAVSEICRRVDGLPLAVELVATRVRLLPPKSILARLGHPLRLLTGGPQDLPGRHETMRDAIEWSYQLLAEDEQRLFRWFSVFVGGCSLRAAEAVCNEAEDASIKSDHLQAIEVLDRVQSLVDKSLVRKIPQEGEESDSDPRVVMLETVREYALEHLEASGETEALQRRHAAYYLALAERIGPDLKGPEMLTTSLDRLRAEQGNLRAALQWLLDQEQEQPDESEDALRLIMAVRDFWEQHMHFREFLGWLSRALAQAGPRATPLRASSLGLAAVLARRLSDYQKARAFGEEALATARELGDARAIAGALSALGGVAIYQGDYETAGMLSEEALIKYRELGADREIGMTLGNLGLGALYRSDYERAEELMGEALRYCRERGDNVSGLVPATNLGYVAHLQGDPIKARAIFMEVLTTTLKIDSQRSAFRALAGLAGAILAEAEMHPKTALQNLHSAAQAAQLLGLSTAQQERGGGNFDPLSQAEFDKNVATARERLGAEAFTAAREEGKGMTLEQAHEVASHEYEHEVGAGRPRGRGRPKMRAPGGLTAREYEIAAFVASGMTNAEIARQMVVSVRTVETHVANATQKLGLHTRTELASWAMIHPIASRPAQS